MCVYVLVLLLKKDQVEYNQEICKVQPLIYRFKRFSIITMTLNGKKDDLSILI